MATARTAVSLGLSADHTPYDEPVPDEAAETHADRPMSALPSPGARAAAFIAILLGGLAGGLIGYSLVRVQCSGGCGTQRGLGAFVGAVLAAIGMSIVAVLVLRAVGEWKTIEDRRQDEGTGRRS